MVIDLLLYSVLLGLSVPMSTSRAVAIGVAMTWNFWLNRRVTFSEVPATSLIREWVGFCVACSFGAVTNYVISLWLVQSVAFFASQRLLAAVVGIFSGYLFNFLFARLFVFRTRRND